MSEGERRLAAIMYTDVVDYTELTQENESAALRLLEDHRRLVRPIFRSHGGREIKTMGDGFLVEFKSALDATLCAIAVQSALNDRKLARGETLAIRVGIHVGDVIERGNDIYGDAVNVASRIYPLAEPGGVCISGQVYSQVKNKLPYPLTKHPARQLKHVREPVDIYAVALPWEVKWKKAEEQFDPRRIAILPFLNFSPDSNDEYFSDGLTEELISRVSRIPELSVISRTSVMGYKNKHKRASDIGTELKVGTLMEGSVRKSGNRARITVQLIEVGSDRHLWVENFDRDLQDIFAVQTEVAEKVASSLQIKLSAEDRKRIEKGGTSNVEAHTLYLKGMISLWRQDEDSLRAAAGLFEQATKLDPDYALSYCGLSKAFSFLVTIEVTESKAASEKAELYARKALELDEFLAEAHVALSNTLINRYEFAAAEAELERAIELNPNLAEAYFWLPGLYLIRGRRADCIKAAEQELRLDPLSVQTSGNAGSWYYLCGMWDEAIKHLKDAVELDPNASLYLGNLGIAHIHRGQVEEGLEEVKRAWEMGLISVADIAYAYVRAGKSEEARKLLNEVLRSAEEQHVPSTFVAGAYAVLGEKKNALEWLERAYKERAAYLPWTKVDPDFEAVWNESRFKAILGKMGLAEGLGT